jgi:hypothetical protein
MKTFIRVIEYWVPDSDGNLLEFGGGWFGTATRFATQSRHLCFGRGEGLPGQAWEAGHPIVLKELDGNYFRRAEAAKADGLTCGIAIPVFLGERLCFVMIIFCGDDEDHAGAIELWANHPSESPDMNLVDGYYGTTGDTFEFISRNTSFRKGNGLPGMTWERQTPVFLQDLGKGSGFLRADSAVKVGINRGFAMPCPARSGDNYVLAFLSALGTPIAASVEIWEPSPGHPHLRRTFAFGEPGAQMSGTDLSPISGAGIGPVGQAYLTAVPVVADSMISLPVITHGAITAVIALFF